MSVSEPYTTADAVRDELDVTQSEYPSQEDGSVSEETLLDRWIDRAHLLVMKRLPGVDNTELLTELETLVAAHFGYARITGAESGQRKTQMQRGSRSVSYADPTAIEAGPDGNWSPYWANAVTLDGRIGDAPTETWSVSVN